MKGLSIYGKTITIIIIITAHAVRVIWKYSLILMFIKICIDMFFQILCLNNESYVYIMLIYMTWVGAFIIYFLLFVLSDLKIYIFLLIVWNE